MMQAGPYLVDVFSESQAFSLPPWELIGAPESAGHPAWFIWRQEREHVMAHRRYVEVKRQEERQAVKKATGQR